MAQEQVTIIDRATSQDVVAVLETDLPPLRIVAVERLWMPRRLDAIEAYLQSGSPLLQHGHWNWAVKALEFNPTHHRFLGIEVAGEVQGLILTHRRHLARLQPDQGAPLLYVEYVETAPWNAREYTATPRYKGIGPRLLEAAVVQSQNEGFSGRVGLHSLTQAEPFVTVQREFEETGAAARGPTS